MNVLTKGKDKRNTRKVGGRFASHQKKLKKISTVLNKRTEGKPERQEKTTIKDEDLEEEILLNLIASDPQKEENTRQRPVKMVLEEMKNLFTELRRDIKEDMEENKKVLITEITMLKNEMKRKEGKTKEEVEKFIKGNMGLESKTKEIYSIGKEGQKKRTVVKLKNWEDKLEILKNKKKLQNTQLNIDNDLKKKEREVQASIRDEARRVRNERWL
ncbi:hypothetical protein FQA39_LY00588 [Lamprigera yunnana]|nr:hypothetical protein FQA39_LY00588 [Lamprigera yunnana]